MGNDQKGMRDINYCDDEALDVTKLKGIAEEKTETKAVIISQLEGSKRKVET